MNPKKVYGIDSAFVHRLGFSFSENKGRILENIVFLDLLRQGKEVFYHTGKKECDFVIKKGLKIVEAIQVTYSLNDSNFEREISGLLEAMEYYRLGKGTILCFDTIESSKPIPNGIEVQAVWKWLLS